MRINIFVTASLAVALLVMLPLPAAMSQAETVSPDVKSSSPFKYGSDRGVIQVDSQNNQQPVKVPQGKVKIAVLMASDKRQETFAGFSKQLSAHAKELSGEYEMIVRNAGGDRSKLPAMAAELISARPDIAIACGGIEADAFKEATEGTDIPVVFLAASSTVNRGLVASMTRPGGNVTGIDTNDTALIEKRLWYVRKILPEAKTVLIFHVPDISPSTDSLSLAKEIAPSLGLELKVVEVSNSSEVEQAARSLKRNEVDVIQLVPSAPIDAVVKELILPYAMAGKIPIMGYNEESIHRGAFAAYGSSRRECGAQAARLAIKILHGDSPQNLPVETPERLVLMINRSMVEALELSLPGRIWRLADVTEFIP